MEGWKDPTTPVIWICAGCLVIIMFTVFIILFALGHIKRIKAEALIKEHLMLQHQKNLLSAAVKSEEKEKNRIALELHDDVLAQLHRIKLMNDNLQISELLNASISQIRHISHNLVPPFLYEMPMENVFIEFLFYFETHYKITIHTNNYVNKDLLENELKLQIFRIFQELIVNIVKHSKASSISIKWRKTLNYCCFSIQDNGMGIDQKTLKKGLGLKNIDARTKIIDGHYRFDARIMNGTRFNLLIPMT